MMKRLLALILALCATSVLAQSISQLPPATTPLDGTEVLPIVQAGQTRKATTASVGQTITATANTWSGSQNFPSVSIGLSPVSGFNSLDITKNSQLTTRLIAFGGAGSDTNYPYLQLQRGLGTRNSPSPLTVGVNMGGLLWWGYDGLTPGHDGTGFYPGARILAQSQENWGALHHGTTLYFTAEHINDIDFVGTVTVASGVMTIAASPVPNGAPTIGMTMNGLAGSPTVVSGAGNTWVLSNAGLTVGSTAVTGSSNASNALTHTDFVMLDGQFISAFSATSSLKPPLVGFNDTTSGFNFPANGQAGVALGGFQVATFAADLLTQRTPGPGYGFSGYDAGAALQIFSATRSNSAGMSLTSLGNIEFSNGSTPQGTPNMAKIAASGLMNIASGLVVGDLSTTPIAKTILVNTGASENLTLSASGNYNKITFATGMNVQGGASGDPGLQLNVPSSGLFNFLVNNVSSFVVSPFGIKMAASTYAALPTCNSSNTGTVAYITDASVAITTWHQAVSAGGGSNKAFITCNGSTWNAFSY